MTRAEEIMYVSGKVPGTEKNGRVKIKRSGDLLYDLVSSCDERLTDGESILSEERANLLY